jgi:hypothetical protein
MLGREEAEVVLHGDHNWINLSSGNAISLGPIDLKSSSPPPCRELDSIVDPANFAIMALAGHLSRTCDIGGHHPVVFH